MIKFKHVEVLLEVDGTEEVAFAKLFDKYIRRWHRAMEEQRERSSLVETDSRVHPGDGG